MKMSTEESTKGHQQWEASDAAASETELSKKVFFFLIFVTEREDRATASTSSRTDHSYELTSPNYRGQVTAVTWSVLWVTPDGPGHIA